MTNLVRRLLVGVSATALVASACAKGGSAPPSQTAMEAVTPKEASAISEEAYIYAFPIMENYRTMYVQAIDRNAPGSKRTSRASSPSSTGW